MIERHIRERKSALAVSLLAMFAVGTTLVQAKEGGIAADAGNTIITVSVQAAHSGVPIAATVIPYKEVTFTAQLPGRVQYIAGEEGARMPAGQVLVAIDDTKLLAQRRAAEADIFNAQSAIQNAQVQYSRELYSATPSSRRPMAGMGFPSMFDRFFTPDYNPYLDRRADLHNQFNHMNQAQAAYLQAQSQLQAVDAQLRDTRSMSPFAGVIMKKHVELGDTVQPGQPLMTFAHIQVLRLQANVPARLVRNLRVGQVIPATLDMDKKPVAARVSQIYPLANNTQHTVTIKFDLPVGAPAATGMYAEVYVPDHSRGQKQQPVIPISSLLRGGSLPRVLVVNNNTSELRVVRLGQQVDAQHVVVLAGLEKGDQLINNPPAGAKSGWMPNH